MKRETCKEMGKYLLDISKILLALTMVTPFLKNESIPLIVVGSFFVFVITGIYLTNKGAKDE